MTSHPLSVYRETLTDRSLISRFSSGRADKSVKFTAERSYVLQLLQTSEKLRKCTPQSIQSAMLDVAFSGLTLSPTQKLLYLIPYGEQCQLLIGYRGLEQLAYRTGVINSIQAVLVKKNDPVFRVGMTPEGVRFVAHEEARDDRGEVTHSYCIAIFTNGGRHVEVMDRADLEAVQEAATKSRDPNKPGGAVWRSKFRGEMQKKAVIRRAWKHWPQDTDGRLERAQKVLDTLEPITFEGEAVRVLSQMQVGTLTDMCAEYGFNTDTLCRAFGLASLSLMPEGKYEEAVRLISPV